MRTAACGAKLEKNAPHAAVEAVVTKVGENKCTGTDRRKKPTNKK